MNVFEACSSDAKELALQWGQNTFKLNRLIYRQQDPLCELAERAVWVSQLRLLHLT